MYLQNHILSFVISLGLITLTVIITAEISSFCCYEFFPYYL